MALRRLTYSTEYGNIMVHDYGYSIEAAKAGLQTQPPARVCAIRVQCEPDRQVGIWLSRGTR
jgi:hypothetical protein